MKWFAVLRMANDHFVPCLGSNAVSFLPFVSLTLLFHSCLSQFGPSTVALRPELRAWNQILSHSMPLLKDWN
jgi:hypothetical protein